MGEKTDYKVIIDGQEIQGISERNLYINYERNTFERDCEIATIYGIIHFKAVFTREQWEEFKRICKTVGENNK